METLPQPGPSAHPGRHRALALGAALALAMTLLLPAAASAQDGAVALPAGVGDELAVHYVGALEGSDLYAAVVDRGYGVVSVYLCDGADVGLWLEGTIADGTFEAAGADGATVTGSLDPTSATGSASLADGTTLDLALTRAALPAGLYERYAVEAGELVRARTIVLPDGTAKGKRAVLGLGWSDPLINP